MDSWFATLSSFVYKLDNPVSSMIAQ